MKRSSIKHGHAYVREPKKLVEGLTLSERVHFARLYQQCALPWQTQAGLIASVAKGKIRSLDQMIGFIESVAGKGENQSQSQKDSDQRIALWKTLSLPELEKLTALQWDLYIECLFLCHTFWPTDSLHKISGWQEAWYHFCGLPTLPPSSR